MIILVALGCWFVILNILNKATSQGLALTALEQRKDSGEYLTDFPFHSFIGIAAKSLWTVISTNENFVPSLVLQPRAQMQPIHDSYAASYKQFNKPIEGTALHIDNSL